MCLFYNTRVLSQTLPNTPQKDTSLNKTNTNKWSDAPANITYTLLNSEKTHIPDTGLHTFHRRPFIQPWSRDLGNPGSPALNLLFTPDNNVGPNLGYHINDIYRYQTENLKFYNTNRPYSVFQYHLGSKLEQVASILHTQNIQPNWNVMVEYKKINTPGFYKSQRNNHDQAVLTTNYKSINKHYELWGAIAYNKFQHDENGGIVNSAQLNDAAYSDRKTVDVAYQNTYYSSTRSIVSNLNRNFDILFNHAYTFGRTDTTYSKDSTSYTYKLVPRFRLSQKININSERHAYKDVAPDSFRYDNIFQYSFPINGAPYYVANQDSLYFQQNLFTFNHHFSVDGIIGKDEKAIKFSAGLGTRADNFDTRYTADGSKQSNSVVSNYLTGMLQKEALSNKAWEYEAALKLYYTGEFAGNSQLDAHIAKSFSQNTNFSIGLNQTIANAPYAFTRFDNKFSQKLFTFNSKENVNAVFAELDIEKYHFKLGGKIYNINNYFYINANEAYAQYKDPISVSQLWLRKMFRIGNFYLDNEVVYQKYTADAPLNIPELMGRHQLSYEKNLFKNALRIATGVEVRYNTAYHPAGYSATLNRFYYQNSTYISNNPEISYFLNFRVKTSFRAFIMFDQLQQLFGKNMVLYTAPQLKYFNSLPNTNIPVYAMQNAMIRFGFSWTMVN